MYNIDANILFYSNNMNLCLDLIRILKNENLIQYFHCVCVDDKLEKLPSDMIVPCMKIKGTNKLWVAEETFEWIKQAKFLRNIRQKQFLTQEQQKNSIPGFNKLEHNSKSDKFTLIEPNARFFSQNYVKSNNNGNIILTPPKENDSDKIKKKDQDNLINKIDNLRELQDKEFKDKSKLEQAEALAKNEL